VFGGELIEIHRVTEPPGGRLYRRIGPPSEKAGERYDDRLTDPTGRYTSTSTS
jgi:hypothetical protein